MYVCMYVCVRACVQLITNANKVQGKQVVVNGVTIKKFLGVPYGAAPAGNLRWKPVC